METLTKTVLSIFLVLFGIIIDGVTFQILWGWFIVGTFDAPPLTLSQALGVSLIIGYARYGLSTKKEEEEKGVVHGFVKSFITTCVVAGSFLFYGWIITLFM